jgi:hypothetical protein
MKKVLSFLFVFAFITFTMISCGSKSDPKEVSKNFLNALGQMDYETAKKYGTSETGKMLDMLSSFSGMMPDSVKNKAKEAKIEIKSAKEDGDKCEVVYTTTDKAGDQTLNLVKKEGKWLVNMSKDEGMDGAATDMPTTEDSTTEEVVPMTDSVKK